MVEVPLGHDYASSSVDVLTLQWFSPVTEEEENGLMKYKLQAQQWGDTADESRYGKHDGMGRPDSGDHYQW